MKLAKYLITATLAGVTSLSAVEILGPEEKPAGCTKIADIRVGDLFNRFSRDTAQESAVEEARRLGAAKITLQLTTHSHPKLGKSYTATAVAWKCGQ